MWLISVWFIAYVLSILFLIFGIHRLRADRSKLPSVPIDQITVVIPFRNEGKNLQQFMDCIYRQRYQPVQWIFVNDHSSDDYRRYFEEMQPFPIRLLHLPPEQQGKKMAIRFGMDHVTTDYCLTMDADVVFGNDYMKQMLTVPAADLVILPVEMTSTRWWQHFFSLEYLFTALLNRGVAGWSRPVNASGANLLIHVASFDEVDDIDAHGHIASGDDMYTLRAFRAGGKTIEIMEDEALKVFTPTPDSLSQVMDQRVRWLGKTSHVGDHLNSFLGVWAVLLHLYFFLLMLITWFSPEMWITFLLVVIKGGLDYMLIRTIRDKWTPQNRIGLLLFEICYPVYILTLLGSSAFAQPEWKGR